MMVYTRYYQGCTDIMISICIVADTDSIKIVLVSAISAFPSDLARAQCACVPVEHMCAVNGKMADRYRSSLWNFFKICIEDESKATCDVCKQKKSRGGKKN